MRPCSYLRGLFFLFLLAAILATGLLRTEARRAQSQQSDKPSTSSQPSAADKSSQKDDQASDGTTTRLKIHVTNSQDKPVGNASVYVRFNQAGGFMHKDKLAELRFQDKRRRIGESSRSAARKDFDPGDCEGFAHVREVVRHR